MSKPQTMQDLVAAAGNRLISIKENELFEVKILQSLKNKILVDVGGLSLGIIPEQEFSPDMGDLKVGDKILAYVLTVENDDGYVILSLRRADKERISKLLATKFETGDVLQVKASSANKGGLICQFGDFEGFLPVSQLTTSHYPKVNSGDRDEIYKKLHSLVGQNFRVKILNFEPGSGKLIFSEKAAGDLIWQEKLTKIKIGQKLTGEITGIVNFGLFVKVILPDVEEEMEGLIHISEVSWDHVEDLNNLFKIGHKIDVEVISTDNNRLSLSIKKLQPDPWLKESEGFKVGDEIPGSITKITPFGAFVKVGSLDGLVHISELGEKVSDPKEKVEEGKSYKFRIISIEPELHKLSLSMKDLVKQDDKKIQSKTTSKITSKAKTKKVKK
ncbi:MAG: RNA binding S1 domain protein [Berkelbacteria bacterium GW2011_GWB1_38_5]|uniref:RNA binding S1 domain protein n=2 Tax=Candidatus Berkelbacteria TaxID=1618330 RepID=A0A0G0LFW6_9BACT|nr:MAG: RNA binding S1 domain protein [Berkelbacteria bacterium GW2011_GWB1_38_5]KKQ90753.1 MAG: RNA binding S1 domain protein [Berkelbacteria bacterium GW2011_GWA1_39_10]